MASKLPTELRQEVLASINQAVPLVDEHTGKVFFVCDEAFLFGDKRDSELSREQLRGMIQEGIESGNVEKQEAHDRMRATIEKYRAADA